MSKQLGWVASQGRVIQLRAVLPALLLAMGATVTGAAPVLRVDAFLSYGDSINETTASTGPLSASASGSGVYGSDAVTLNADYGLLRIYSEATAHRARFLNERHVVVASGGSASFRDTVTINSAGRAGTRGSVTVQFTVDGALSTIGKPNGDGNYTSARAEFAFFVDPGAGDLEKFYRVRAGATALGSNFLGEQQTSTFEFEYGKPFEMGLGIKVSTHAYAMHGGHALADLSHTAEWGGFGAVLDASGNEVLDFTTTSASGFDYSQPVPVAVPEPASLGLLSVAACGLAVLGRGRSKRRYVRHAAPESE